jgi:hypothetical protein
LSEDTTNGTLVCIYNRTWYEVEKNSQHIWVGDQQRDIHQYNLLSFTPESIAPILAEAAALLSLQEGLAVSPSKLNPATEASEEGGSIHSESRETNTDEQPDPVNL